MPDLKKKKSLKELWIFVIIIALLILARVLVDLVLYLYTRFETTITVSNKYIRTVSRASSRYHVVDKKGENFRVENVWFKGDFNRGDEYGILEEGKKYKVKGYGKRVPFLNMYRKIYNIEKV